MVSPMVDLRQTGHGHDVPGAGLLDLHQLDAARGRERGDRAVERHDATRLDAAVRRLRLLAQHRDTLAHAQAAVADAADGHAAHVVVGGEVGDEHLQRVTGHVTRRRRVRHEEVHERLQVLAGCVRVETGRAGAGVGVDDGKLDLAVRRAEVHEELVDVVHDDRGPRVGAVDLVDGHDHRQVLSHGLGEDVAGLGQRAFRGVHEQQDRVDHEQAALDLTPEVGMAGGVHDVEADALVGDAGLLGEDGDAALALEVHGVHDAVHDHLVDAEGAGLAEHGIHQGGLAVIDMRHDGDVAHVCPGGLVEHGGGRSGVHGKTDCRTHPGPARILSR